MNRIIYLLLVTLIFSFANVSDSEKKLQEKIEEFYGISSHPEIKCGFAQNAALNEIYDDLSPALQKAADILLELPVRETTIQSPSAHFNLHFDTTGTHSVPLEDLAGNGIPDYIDSAAVFLDFCWQIMIDDIGFMAPINENGEVSAYNIYFTNFPYSYYYGETTFGEAVNGHNYPSYIELNNDFTESGLFSKGLDGLRVTAAHEFFHAIQVSYNFWGSSIFFYEMSSSWIEEIIYPDVNDYLQYLPDLFESVQEQSLFSRSNEYANALYLHMLSQKYDISLLKEIWDQTSNIQPVDALSNSLNNKNSSVAISINDYGKWLYFTGERTLFGQYYVDADSFPTIAIDEDLTFDGSLFFSTDFPVFPGTFKFLKAEEVTEPSNIAKVTSGWDNTLLKLNIISENLLDRKPSNQGVYTAFNLGNQNRDVAFVVSNAAGSRDTVSFEFIPDSILSIKNSIKIGPNPVAMDMQQQATFYFVPIGSKIIILDINNRTIRSLQNDSNFDQLTWNMRDSNGNYVSSGIYYYIVMLGGKSQKIGKIAVIR